ncbi:hypothetical protein BN903_46 [Halorubrum sp. AJ67]|nr:hypothetical protein BN903_46 [Halorubrum sp. AJ67]
MKQPLDGICEENTVRYYDPRTASGAESMRMSSPVSKTIAVTRNPPANCRRSDGRDSASPDRANPTAATSELMLGTPRRIPK